MKSTRVITGALCIFSFAALAADNLAITGPGAGADGSSKAGSSSYGFVKDGNLGSFWQPVSTSNERVSVKWSSAIQFNQVILREDGNEVTSWRLVNHDTGNVLAAGSTIGTGLTVNLGDVSMKKLNLLILTAHQPPKISEIEVYQKNDILPPDPIEPQPPVDPEPTPDPGAGTPPVGNPGT